MQQSEKNKSQHIKDLETIVEIQERTIAAEKQISHKICNMWHDQEQIIVDWEYSYWKLKKKFSDAMKEIRFLNHFINQKEIKKGKHGKKK